MLLLIPAVIDIDPSGANAKRMLVLLKLSDKSVLLFPTDAWK